jgi:membrane associated rhomboid family serine protease
MSPESSRGSPCFDAEWSMIPIKDDNPRIAFPFITILFILVNGIVFLYQMLYVAEPQAFVYRFGTIPWEITHFTELNRLPPEYHSEIPNVLTLFSSMFIHGGILHLAGNMLYLWIFGDNVEGIMGHGRFFFFYLCCGLAASVSHVLIAPDSTIPMVGASGAISGILGAYFIRFPRAKVHVVFILILFIRVIRIPALFVLGFWFVVQLLSGLIDMGPEGNAGVAWFAHIGGFAAGIILVFFFEKKERVRIYRRANRYV